MGLGKTLSILALIASDKDTTVLNSYTVNSQHLDSVDSTLVVVPPNGKSLRPHFASLFTLTETSFHSACRMGISARKVYSEVDTNLTFC